MNKFIYRATLIVVALFGPILFPLLYLWENRKQIINEMLEFYSLLPKAFEKGGKIR